MSLLFIGEGTINSLLISLVALVFELIAKVFELFAILSQVGTIDSSFYNQLVRNFYLVLTVVMLFAIAFGLLKAMINPDDSKGAGDAGNIFKKIVSSIIILTVLPMVFNFAFGLQNAIISQNTIGKLFGDDNSNITSASGIKVQGNKMANAVFTAFFTPTEKGCDGAKTISECQQNVNSSDWNWISSSNLAETIASVNATGNFGDYSVYGDAVADNKISFNFIVLLFGGLFFAYVVLSFCFDLGIRAVKLVFYQIIAPIPVLLRIVPQEKLSGTFNTWVKIVVSCYLEVFIRLFVLYFGVYLASAFTTGKAFGGIFDDATGFNWLFAKAILIMSIIVFIKECPKLIADIFGIDSGNMKLGLKDKLAAGGLFAAGGAVGSLITSRGNPLAAYRGWKNGLTNIGAEFEARRNKKEALAQGVTRRQMFRDNLLRKLGFESSHERDDRLLNEKRFDAENSSDIDIEYTDINGNRKTINSGEKTKLDQTDVDNLNARKREISSNISSIKENISNIDERNKENTDIINERKYFKDEYEKKVEEGEYTGKYEYLKKENVLDDSGNVIDSKWVKKTYQGDLESVRNLFSQVLTVEEQQMTSNYDSTKQEYQGIDIFDENGTIVTNFKGEDMKHAKDRFGEEYAMSGANKKVTDGINKALASAAAEGAKKEFYSQEFRNGIATGRYIKTTMNVVQNENGEYEATVTEMMPDGTTNTTVINDVLQIISKRDKLAKDDDGYQGKLRIAESSKIKDQESIMKAIDSLTSQHKEAVESYKDTAEYKRREISSTYVANRKNDNK